MSNRPAPVIFLMGPTAAGKTELAVRLAEQLPLDIVSVDSAMVYRGLDIGTAKPGSATLVRAPHRLIDILDPTETYSAARFCTDARQAIEQIQAAGRIPLLTGGTMLYFRALEQGLNRLPVADPVLRARLAADLERLGSATLHARLAQVDAISAARIHPNDPQRIQRALEVHALTGEPLSTHFSRPRTEIFPYRIVKLAVAPAQRTVLHERIQHRFELMLNRGFIEEVEQLLSRRDLDLSKPALRAVGYRQVGQYLAGQLDYASMRERGIIATRQYAKRQLTWLRKEAAGYWLDSGSGTHLRRCYGICGRISCNPLFCPYYTHVSVGTAMPAVALCWNLTVTGYSFNNLTPNNKEKLHGKRPLLTRAILECTA